MREYVGALQEKPLLRELRQQWLHLTLDHLDSFAEVLVFGAHVLEPHLERRRVGRRAVRYEPGEEPLAHVWSSVVPWLSAWTLYQGSVTLKLLSWSGLVLNGFIDFLMPGLVTIISLGAAKRALHCWGRQSLDVEETPSLTQAMPSSPIAPFPDWLRPYYREVVTAMLAFLLVLLPLCLWLQMYCSGSKACYPVV